MVRIPSMVAGGLFVSVLALSACGGNKKTTGTPTDGSAGADGGGTGGVSGGNGGNAGAGQGGMAGIAGSGQGGMAGIAGSGQGGTAGTAGAGGTTTPVPITCDGLPVGTVPQCNDGMDNDMDGQTDAFDLECQSPCDNDEGSFSTGIPGDNMDACKQDCFFDGNSGQGDDGCDWNLKCDPANPGGTSCPYVAGTQNCRTEQSAKCLRNCRKLAPNGCDCFGCCQVDVGGQQVGVILVGTCNSSKFGDPVACPRCTVNDSCLNTCETCEVCFGKPAPPASCTPTTPDGGTPAPDSGTPPPQCPSGMTICSPTMPCASGSFCQTGCCVPYVID